VRLAGQAGHEVGPLMMIEARDLTAVGATLDIAERFTANLRSRPRFIAPGAASMSACPARRTRASARPSISRRSSITKRFRFQSLILIPVPSSHICQKNGLISLGNIVDERGNQLPKVVYENLNEAELMDWVERFYSEYYFRPKLSGGWCVRSSSIRMTASA